jgi:hypothetical protein
MRPVIAESARRHGIVDEDMRHAYRQPIMMWDVDEGMQMLVGPTRAAVLIEVGVVHANDGTPVIVHAMAARPKFLR